MCANHVNEIQHKNISEREWEKGFMHVLGVFFVNNSVWNWF